MEDKNQNIAASAVRLISEVMTQCPDHAFADVREVIAYVCDLLVEIEDLCEECYLGFCHHLPISLEYTVGILASKQSFYNELGVTNFKQILTRLNLLILTTKMFEELNGVRGESNAYPYPSVFTMLAFTL